MSRSVSLQVRVLGEFQLLRGNERLLLPQSKKTRALLAYLIVTGRPHSRSRLCSIFWDVPDDPRGALRWSLSKLRVIVNDGQYTRLLSDRESISFDSSGIDVDLFILREVLRLGIKGASTEALEDLARLFRGRFLDGLELPEFHEYQAWRIAQAEQVRLDQISILWEIVGRLEELPERALPYAREIARIDLFTESAHAILIKLLACVGRHSEAEQQCAAAIKLLKTSGVALSGTLDEAWKSLARLRSKAPAIPSNSGQSSPDREPELSCESAGSRPPVLVGRRGELQRLISIADEVQTRRKEKAVLLTGEPGVGKSRLLAELSDAVLKRGGTVLAGCGYEVERGRPYVPWVDAIRSLPPHSVAKVIGTDLAPLLPELPHESGTKSSRNRLFGSVVELIAARAHSAPPVLLAFDDIHWFDGASAELLHYTTRMNRHRPVLIALAARSGDLTDNEAVHRAVLSLSRDELLEQIPLDPLSREEVSELVRAVKSDADPDRIFDLSAGNPLFALEIARSMQQLQEPLSPTVTHIVRERIDRLHESSRDVLRWSAAVGPMIGVRQLAELTGLELWELMSVLEGLERHGLLLEAPKNAQPRGDYTFAHDIVREAVYSDVSKPRLRLMHLQIAQALNKSAGLDEGIAAEIARHAALGGDFSMAAAACVSAGRRYLRLFAGSEAAALAELGMQYAERLMEPERVQRSIELYEIRIASRRPDRTENAASILRELAARALDHGCHEHARLGFQMLGYLRWEKGDWSGARRDILQAEQVSRGADDKEHAVAMAEAARCLTLLERDLGEAEALALQAGALSVRLNIQSPVIPDAQGMLRLHEGKIEEAAALFQHAILLAKNEGNRPDEFQALEHLFMLELQRERYDIASALCKELVVIGEKLREGSEACFARALSALCLYAAGNPGADVLLQEQIDDLRISDAKHRMAFVLTRAAGFDLKAGNPDRACMHAQEALDIAQLLENLSEIALSRALLVQAADALEDRSSRRRHLQELRRLSLASASQYVQGIVSGLERGAHTGGENQAHGRGRLRGG